jgi:hypothetical protein
MVDMGTAMVVVLMGGTALFVGLVAGLALGVWRTGQLIRQQQADRAIMVANQHAVEEQWDRLAKAYEEAIRLAPVRKTGVAVRQWLEISVVKRAMGRELEGPVE